MSAVGNWWRDVSAMARSLASSGPGVVVPCLAQGLTDPFGDGHTLSAGHTLNLQVFVLVQEHLKAFPHVCSLVDSCTMSQSPSPRELSRLGGL